MSTQQASLARPSELCSLSPSTSRSTPSASAALWGTDGSLLIVDAWLQPFLAGFTWTRIWNRAYWHTSRHPARFIHRVAVAAVSGIAAITGLHVHHVNWNSADNRLENLVPLTPREHSRLTYLTLTPPSAPGWGTTRWRGVWKAQIRLADGRKTHVGTFPSQAEAHAAALLAKFGPGHGYAA